MAFCKFNLNEELKKATKGRPTKMPVGLVLYLAMDNYPAIQKRIADSFGIIED